MGFSIIPALFYVVTIAIAILYPIAPFQTRLSIVLHDRLLRLHHKVPSMLDKTRNFFQPLSSRLRVKADGQFSESFRLWTDVKRWLSGFTTPATMWLSLQTSRLYAFGRQACSLPTPSPTSEDTPALLDMSCIIFTCKRISTLHKIGLVLPALDALVQSLPGDPDRNHPITSLFTQAVISSVIEPINYSTRTQDYQIAWEAAGIDLRYLVRAVHYIFIGQGYTSDFSYEFQIAIGGELWVSFVRDPLDTVLVEILAQLMANPALAIIPTSREPDPNQDLLIRCIRSCSTYSKAIRYLSLLPHLSHHRKQHGRNSTLPLPPNQETKYIEIVRCLSDTMWGRNGPDLDYWRGWMRVQLLPSHAQDTLLESRFSEYLFMWSQAHVNDPWEGQPLPLQWPYLQSLYKLIQLDSTTWAGQLDRDGHAPFLLQLVLGVPKSINYYEQSTRSLNALFLFFILWNRRRSYPHSIEPNDTPSIYMASDSIRAAVGSFGDLKWQGLTKERILGGISSNLELAVSYFEEASRLNLLTRDMEIIVVRYKRETDSIMSVLSGGGDGFERCRDQRQSLFDRMDRLTFVTQPEPYP